MINYNIIRSQRKTIALHINSDATLTVKLPYGVSIAKAEKFIAKKSRWIEKKQAEFITAHEKHKPKQYINGEAFYFVGKRYELEIVPGSKAGLSLTVEGKFKITEKCLEAPKHYIEWFYKQFAKQYLVGRTAELANTLGYRYSSIKINSAKTRWGSCSLRGNINYSWRLVMLPAEMIDYVITHELVHLEIHNHSRKFYSRLQSHMPDHKRREKWLKENAGMAIL
ncbi:MAG: M48 family metallopeptidase [Ignavibacteria bacterium]|nr:M48 family metallopeptidase [Ignavibacteria bacterium]